MLHHSCFSSKYLQWLFTTSEFILRPYIWSLNMLASVFLPITPEKENITSFIVKHVPWIPFYICIQIILFLPASVAFVVRCILYPLRVPYILSVSQASLQQQSEEYVSSNRNMRNLSITTANVCTLPEFFSRYNNFANPRSRTRKIGQNIIVDQYFYAGVTKDRKLSSSITKNLNHHKRSFQPTEKFQNEHIITHFPQTDFMCFQETWDRDNSKILISELHKVFPWVLYDVGITSFSSNYFMFNSGLMFASRYPILDADFKHYKNCIMQSVFTSLGLLMVKVQVPSIEKENRVGYIYTTHLQPYQGSSPIIKGQLDDIIAWTEEFRKDTQGQSDRVVFDIVCGDFNFDNMSPGEQECWDHPIFSLYEDFGRVRPGQDKYWTVGTDMRQKYIWHKNVSTPEGLKETLQDPVLRQRHVSDADIVSPTYKNIVVAEPRRNKNGHITPSEVGGRRRIDYILHRKDCKLDVQNYRYITRLSTMTDHLPICMEFCTEN